VFKISLLMFNALNEGKNRLGEKFQCGTISEYDILAHGKDYFENLRLDQTDPLLAPPMG
jgi:hypothetical protein